MHTILTIEVHYDLTTADARVEWWYSLQGCLVPEPYQALDPAFVDKVPVE